MEEPSPQWGEGLREGGREGRRKGIPPFRGGEEGRPLREVESSDPSDGGGRREGRREGGRGGREVGKGGEEGGKDLPFLPPALALHPFLSVQDMGQGPGDVLKGNFGARAGGREGGRWGRSEVK